MKALHWGLLGLLFWTGCDWAGLEQQACERIGGCKTRLVGLYPATEHWFDIVIQRPDPKFTADRYSADLQLIDSTASGSGIVLAAYGDGLEADGIALLVRDPVTDAQPVLRVFQNRALLFQTPSTAGAVSIFRSTTGAFTSEWDSSTGFYNQRVLSVAATPFNGAMSFAPVSNCAVSFIDLQVLRQNEGAQVALVHEVGDQGCAAGGSSTGIAQGVRSTAGTGVQTITSLGVRGSLPFNDVRRVGRWARGGASGLNFQSGGLLFRSIWDVTGLTPPSVAFSFDRVASFTEGDVAGDAMTGVLLGEASLAGTSVTADVHSAIVATSKGVTLLGPTYEGAHVPVLQLEGSHDVVVGWVDPEGKVHLARVDEDAKVTAQYDEP